MKYLIQIFVPFQGEQSNLHAQVKEELAGRFGGLTTFVKAPAEGLWKDEGDSVTRDRIVVFEVMTTEVDREWWTHYRRGLEERFTQDSILVRVLEVEQL